MHRLLVPLLAAFALPTAANAEIYWLMAAHRAKTGIVTWTVPIGSSADCEAAGQSFMYKDWQETLGRYKNYLCVKGK